jgi:EmrB/QacA subfamily drug resistance transporter
LRTSTPEAMTKETRGTKPAQQPTVGTTKGVDPKWWTLVAVSLGTFMLLLDLTVVNVALPQIQSSLHSTFTGLQWVVDAYALTLAALLLTSGSLADLYGRKRLWMIGLVIFTAASALCGAAQSPLMLEISRGVQGVGGAIMFADSLAILGNAFRGKDQGIAFGIWGAITAIAAAVGPIVGGAVVSGLSWRYIFFLNIPIAVVAGAVSLARIGESRNPAARRPDWPGLVLFTAALASLVYALTESDTAGFGAPQVIGTLVGAGVLLVAFVAVEWRNDQAMLDLPLFKVPTFSGGNIAGFAMSVGIFSVLLYLVLYLQDVLHYSPLGTGVRLLLLSGAVFVVSGLSGRLSSSVPVRFLIGPGLALVGVGLVLMMGLDASSDWTHLIPGLAVAGAGLGLIEPPLASTAIGVVRPERAGMASGINVTFRQVGISVGIALLGTIFATRLGAFVTANTASTPLHPQAGAIATAVKNDHINTLFQTLPRAQDGVLVHVLRASYASALNDILLVAAIITFVCAVLCFVLIRQKDFIAQNWDSQDEAGGEGWDAGAWEQGAVSAGSWPQQGSLVGPWPQGDRDSTPQVPGATGPGSSQPTG